MRLIRLFVIIVLCFRAGYAGSCGQEKHRFCVSDMLAMERVSEPQVSPDGRLVVFIVKKTNLEDNKITSDLWLVGASGQGLRRLTGFSGNDTNPRWSADGKKIWFISDRTGSSQVWCIRIDGGEAEQVTKLGLDVENLIVSTDGEHIAFTMKVFPDCNTLECTKDRLEKIKEKKSSGRIYDRIFVRHWDEWKDGRRSHLFVKCVQGGEPVDVMQGMDADTPSVPFGGPEEIMFTPDGKELIFTARNVGREEPWSTDFDLYRVAVDGSHTECITEENKAWDTNPTFSPDGKTLAFLAMQRPGYESDRYRVVLYSWPDGQKRILTEDWDLSPSSICWSPDCKTIYATAANKGQKSLFAIDVTTGNVSTIIEEGYVSSPVTAGEKIICCLDNFQSPGELYCVEPVSGDLHSVTQINIEKVAATLMGEYEQFSFEGWNGEIVYCNVIKPAGLDTNKKYPVVFLIHGGPQSSFTNHFHYRWNPQALAGAGYAVVMVDFHGSVGYGQEFTDSIRGDWGGKPLEDLQKGLAAALQRYRWMDENKIGAMGGSFGGYMVNWIAGAWPGRFRCIVNHAGSIDERMSYFDTEELWFPEWDHLGTPWSNPESYEKHNPVNFVKNWRTPMLVIHGALDFRVPCTQGIGTFNALQRRGIESKFLYYPDEGHWILKPHNLILWYDTVIDWLDRWLKD